MTKRAIEVGELLSGDPRSERRRGKVDGVEVELRVVKDGLVVDKARFLDGLEALAQLSHPSLRMIRGGVVLDDGRPAAVLSLVPWTTLHRSARQPVESLVSLGVEVADALATLHAAGLSLGQVSPADLFPGSPAVLDASLVGLAPRDASAESDVRSLAQVLLAAGSGSKDASPFETALQRSIADRVSAATLSQTLESLRARAQARTVSGNHLVVEVEVMEPQLEGQTLSAWKIEKVLGEGAMAKVYLATDTRTGEKAALKVLKQEHLLEPEFVHRFVQEVQAVNAIENQHIVGVTHFGDEPLPDGRRCVYCVMEVLEGFALAEAINHGPFAIRRTVNLGQQVARALHAAHEVGVVHRDVKPENIFLITRHGEPDFVKVLDFGVAKLLRPIGDLKLVGTKAGVVVGTPEYMAPEQAMGGLADARVDVYAVGLVIYELLTGRQPFIADNFGKLVIEITQSPPPPLPNVTPGGERIPSGLGAVVMRCLEKDPADRFPSAAALADALQPFTGAPAPVVEIDEAALAAAVRPSRLPLIAAVVVVLLLAAAVAWTFVSPPPAEVTPTPVPVKVIEPPAPVPKTVWLDVKSTPVGAQVKRGAEVLGVTPLHVELPRGEAASLSLVLTDYLEETREVVLSENVSLSVDLKPVPKATRAPAPKKKPAKRK
ncbi:MAG: serine/threonine-protein kinase [Archangium sp.]|nr:serine/threonine-protein kinase [Archangium sp.]MDP3152241.1 serine/threonine-protein kinase [Archangium sp.]MDP3571086.1 serine/threonine-protein kinase [Archangium sp.]